MMDLVPFATALRDDVILLKDGSLLRAYSLDPVELDDLEMHNRVKVDEAIRLALRKLTPQCTLWSRMRKRSRSRGLAGEFAQTGAEHIRITYAGQFAPDTAFLIERHLVLVLSPASGWEGFRERLLRRMRAGSGVVPAAWGAFVDGLNADKMLERFESRTEELLAEFDGIADAFRITAGLGLKGIRGDQLRGFLMSCTSLTHAGTPVRQADRWQFLDGYLCSDEVVANRDHLEFRGPSGRKFVQVLGLKEWPESTPAGVLNGLLALPCEFTLSQAYAVASNEAAKSYIRNMQLFYLNTRKDLRQALTEYFTKTPSELSNPEKEEGARNAESALGSLTNAGMFGFHTLHVLVEAADLDQLDWATKKVVEEFEAKRYVTIREGVGQLTAFAGTIPGARSKLARAGFVSSGNVSAMLPAYGPSSGSEVDPYFTEQMGSPQPALIQLQTPYNVPYNFCIHKASDAAHTLIVGPTRTGKTVLALLLATHFEKYKPNFVGLDLDRSMRVFAHALNIPYTDPDQGVVRVNPFGLLRNPGEHREFLHRWTIGLLEARGDKLLASEVKEVAEAFERLIAMGPNLHKLSGLASQLPTQLRERLAPWTDPAGLGQYFDNAEDSFSISGRMAIEMGGWMRNDEIAGPMLDYLFYRIYLLARQSASTRTPTLIYIPEVWFALKNPMFNARIEQWLKTMAKFMCSVIMDSQSISDVAAGGAFAAFRACVPMLVFSADSRANADREFYKKNFALTDLQVDLIARGVPKRSYVLLEGTDARVLDVQVPASALAFLRSDVPAQRFLDQALATVQGDVANDEWRRTYLRLINPQS